jgi:wyosine [tRNA(Phe)-imidazoG37] synthetase (radical SAM superfamily)
MQHPLLDLVAARGIVDVVGYGLIRREPQLDRAAYILDHAYPKALCGADNQAYVVIKALSLLHRKEWNQALELLQAASVFHSQDPVLQDIHFRILQEQRDEATRDSFDLRQQFCQLPFHRLDILTGFRSATLCCSSYLPASIGDLAVSGNTDVWMSDTAQRIRESILDGSFAYCNKITCPAISSRTLPQRKPETVEAALASLERGPTWLNLSYDVTCNLSCPSCRTERRHADAASQRFFSFMVQERLLPLLANVRHLEVTGSGDPFASRSMFQLLRAINADMRELQTVQIMTNAQLFSPKVWEAIPGVHGRAHFYVSADATQPETYAKLRRGGSFQRLLTNLAYIAELHRTRQAKGFTLAFVVQRENFRQMPDFVRMAKDLGCSTVYFARLTNWGTFTPEKYQRQCVWLPTHEEHAAFLEVMRDPILRDPLVVQSDLKVFMPTDDKT